MSTKQHPITTKHWQDTAIELIRIRAQQKHDDWINLTDYERYRLIIEETRLYFEDRGFRMVYDSEGLFPLNNENNCLKNDGLEPIAGQRHIETFEKVMGPITAK